jgi:cytochrome bd ubiquinol oxidase subunit II
MYEFLQVTWFFLIGILFVVYSVLDGFDLGVGSLMAFLAKDEKETGVLLNSVGPVWDGNEVWLLTGAGALFAAFPDAYATVFSGFYLALMLVLFALIFRAVSLEFWSLDEGNRGMWKWAFVLGSSLPALLFGVALGNVVYGIPLDANMEFTGNFLTLLRPMPLLIGLLGFMAILMQGSTYISVKTEGEIQSRARNLSDKIWMIYSVFFLLALIGSFIFMPEVISKPFAWVFTVIFIAALIYNKYSINEDMDKKAFVSSSIAFMSLWGIAGSILFPNIVTATEKSMSMNIFKVSSSELSLTAMFIIAVIGMPFVFGYTIYIYRVFSGKVK